MSEINLQFRFVLHNNRSRMCGHSAQELFLLFCEHDTNSHVYARRSACGRGAVDRRVRLSNAA
jgi:hypothetical protein